VPPLPVTPVVELPEVPRPEEAPLAGLPLDGVLIVAPEVPVLGVTIGSVPLGAVLPVPVPMPVPGVGGEVCVLLPEVEVPEGLEPL
jgi:hypothetical protein